MEIDSHYEHVPLLKASDIYETFGTEKADKQRETVVEGLHHLVLSARGIRRFPLLYTLDVLQHAAITKQPPHVANVFHEYARTSDAFYVMQRTERQFEGSLRDALRHRSRPEGTLSSLQMASIFNLGHSTMSLIIGNGEIVAENVAEKSERPRWAITEESVRDFYTWQRPAGYPEYPEPLEPIC